MTLRDFLKANKSLTNFKRLYHERSKTNITYRQIEANLLTAGEDFIINALHISITDCGGYWVGLNTKWNAQLNSETTSNTNKTLGYWLKTNNFEEKFKNAFLRQHPKSKDRLNTILTLTHCGAISSAFTWYSTLEGFDFWSEKDLEWRSFCKKNK